MSFFIAFEGIDGSGKGTQLELVRNWLENDLHYSIACSTEPNDNEITGSPLGKLIRKMVNKQALRPRDPLDFQRLFVVDRAQDVFALIMPALAEKKVFLMDRFALSTHCYGAAGGVSPEKILQLHDNIICSRCNSSFQWIPDLTIIFDLDVRIALERLREPGRGQDIFEKQEFLEKVRAHYRAAVPTNQYSKETVLVDASPSKEIVFEEVKHIIRAQLSFAVL